MDSIADSLTDPPRSEVTNTDGLLGEVNCFVISEQTDAISWFPPPLLLLAVFMSLSANHWTRFLLAQLVIWMDGRISAEFVIFRDVISASGISCVMHLKLC